LIAVAAEAFDVRGKFVGGQAAVEDGDGVAGREVRFGDVTADELGAAEYEDVHGS